MAAAKLIPFVPRSESVATESAAPHNVRFRGLHIVAPGTPATSLPDNTQAQARRIVAQVEREIEQQAARESQHTFQMLHKDLSPLMVQQVESPVTVARRLMGALWCFAHSV